MFVTTLGMDNFDCTKMIAHFKKFTACLREGLIHEWKQALLAPPPPWAYPTNTLLAAVAFLLLLDTNLLPQAGSTHYSQLPTLQHSTKLLRFFLFLLFFFKF